MKIVDCCKYDNESNTKLYNKLELEMNQKLKISVFYKFDRNQFIFIEMG